MDLQTWLTELWTFVLSLVGLLLSLLWLLVGLLRLLLQPIVLWTAFWLFAVDWKKMWKVLAAGAWAPAVLLGLITALVWSRISPSECDCLGFVRLPNFCWQLGSVAGLAICALFAGWLQGLLGIHPIEVNLEPPAHAAHEHHGHH